MASAPTPKMRAAAACAQAGPAQETRKRKNDLCEDCGDDPRVAEAFCTVCGIFFCAECDAAAHVRGRKGHNRVPADQRPALCPVHNKDAEAYCQVDQRLACASCLISVPPGNCFPHHSSVKPIAEAATIARETLATLSQSLKESEECMVKEIGCLREHQSLIEERIERLEAALPSSRSAQAALATSTAQNDEPMLEEMRNIVEKAGQTRDAMVTALGESAAWAVQWKEKCVALERFGVDSIECPLGVCGSQSGQSVQSQASNISFKGTRFAAATAAGMAVNPSFQKLPDLASLPAPRTISSVIFKNPEAVMALHDGSVLVADYWDKSVAQRVWPDGSRPPQPLASATANATAVLPLDDTAADALVVVSYGEGRVERTGSIAWKRTTGLNYPYSAVVVGTTVLVTECGAGRVAQLDLHTGKTIGTFGEGTLKSPRGIAVTPTGEIVVIDGGAKLVRLFDHKGTLLRTLGEGLLFHPFSVCVDGRGRFYVTEFFNDFICVFDGVSGTALAKIKVRGTSRGVAITSKGEIVVSVCKHLEKGWLVVIG